MEYDTVNEEPIDNEDYDATSLNQFIRIGYTHVNHCEDSVFAEESGIHRIVCGVFDGCSSGSDSHLASTLMTKLLRKAIEEMEYFELNSKQTIAPNEFCKKLIEYVFRDLQAINNLLQLKYDELLSTVGIGVYDKEAKSLSVRMIGDGLIMVNEKYHELYFDHKSDYIGYHLDKEYDDFYVNSVAEFEFENVDQFGLSTDGIFSFKRMDHRKRKEFSQREIMDYVLLDNSFRDSPNWIQNKVDYLKSKHGFQPLDDLGIVMYSEL